MKSMKENGQEKKGLIKKTDLKGIALLGALALFTAFIIQRQLAFEEFLGSFLVATLLLAIFFALAINSAAFLESPPQS